MKYNIEIPNDGTIIMNQYGWIFHNNDVVAISMRIEGFDPVVHCKDCKHYNAGFECLIEGYGIERSEDWFCADAERRTDD